MDEKVESARASTPVCVLLVMLALTQSSCAVRMSPHHPLSLSSGVQVTLRTERRYRPHEDDVFLTSSELSGGIPYEVLASLEFGLPRYGSHDEVYQALADAGRSLGADAVIGVSVWNQPSGFSWAAPHGSGTAVRFDNPDSVALDEIKGRWR